MLSEYPVAFDGSLSVFYEVAPGVVTKVAAPNLCTPALEREANEALAIEYKILQHLGPHRRITKFIGLVKDLPSSGVQLQFSRASHGDLETYLQQQCASMQERKRWCMDMAEAIEFIHSKSVVHSDFRLSQWLVDEDSAGVLHLRLCDFGGSSSELLNVDGNHLPDAPFSNPKLDRSDPRSVDIFSLGSLFYVLVTNQLPHQALDSWNLNDDFISWQASVDERFCRDDFPDLTGVPLAGLIGQCWQNTLRAPDIVAAMKSELKNDLI